MPELPEVEHTRKNLERWMRGGLLVAVRTSDARIVRPLEPGTFIRRLQGRKVETIERRGKWIRLGLDDDQKLFIHLGMTGWFEHGAGAVASNPLMNARRLGQPLRFERVRFEVMKAGRRSSIVYVDPRRWGRMVLSKQEISTWLELGPDPLEEGIDPKGLSMKLARRKKGSIKEALMDQRLLAGVGNIQAVEALWKAGIDPRSRASALDVADMSAIARGLRWTFRRTLADLARPKKGSKNPFCIYGRKGEPCPRCGETLEGVELGGRSTTYCPGCQSLRRSRGASVNSPRARWGARS